jgi:hypothetical protein
MSRSKNFRRLLLADEVSVRLFICCSFSGAPHLLSTATFENTSARRQTRNTHLRDIRYEWRASSHTPIRSHVPRPYQEYRRISVLKSESRIRCESPSPTQTPNRSGPETPRKRDSMTAGSCLSRDSTLDAKNGSKRSAIKRAVGTGLRDDVTLGKRRGNEVI